MILGLIESTVCTFESRTSPFAVVHQSGTKRGGEATLWVVWLRQGLGDRGSQLLANTRELGKILDNHANGELLAAPAAGQAGSRQTVLQQLRYCAQRKIASRMAEHIVVALEMIHVAHDHGQWGLHPPRLRNKLVKPTEEFVPTE